MHLERPGLTMTSTRKRKVKVTKAQQAEFENGWRERNIRLKEMGLPKETFEQYMDWVHGRGKKEKTKANKSPTPATYTGSKVPSGSNRVAPKGSMVEATPLPEKIKHNITGPVSSKPSPVYTGKNIIGIAVMHKSCLQPIFNAEEAVDSAKMRR